MEIKAYAALISVEESYISIAENKDGYEIGEPEDASGYSEEVLEEEQKRLLGDLDVDEIQSVVDELLGKDTFSFGAFLGKLVTGEIGFDGEAILTILGEIFYGEMFEQKEMLLQIFLLIIIGAFLHNLGNTFENGQINEIASYIIYLVIFVLLIQSFEQISMRLDEMLSGSVGFMRVLTPAYYLATIAAEGIVSANGYYQVVLMVLYLVQWVLLKILMPGIRIFVLLGIVNMLSKEDLLTKMAELIHTCIQWILRSIVTLVVGMQILQRMVSPIIDQLQRGVIGKAASALPGVGNAIDSVTEMVLGCAVLVRNSIGIAGFVVLLLLAVGPIIQLAATAFMYRLLAAIVQPVTDKMLLQGLGIMSEGMALLLRTLLTAEIMFLVSVALVLSGI